MENNNKMKCWRCRGQKRIRCPFCLGTGKENGKRCIMCEGAGSVTCCECKGTGTVPEFDLGVESDRKAFIKELATENF